MELHVELSYRGFLDLWISTIAAVAAAVALVLIDAPSIRFFSALPLVFVLPGYAITELLFVNNQFSIDQKLLFALGISLCVDVMVGLVLHFTNIPLESSSWTVALAFVAAGANFVVGVLRGACDRERVRTLKLHYHVNTVICLFLALLLITIAVGLASVSLFERPREGFTQLWISPDHPTTSGSLFVGIYCVELSKMSYRLEIYIDKQLTGTYWFELVPYQDYSVAIPRYSGQSGTIEIEANLFRLDDSQDIYRHVRWQVVAAEDFHR